MSRGLQILESVMRKQGLSRAAVARACEVGADVVSRWFSAQLPRKPSKPSRLLSGKLEQLYGIPVPSWDEPATEIAEADTGPPDGDGVGGAAADAGRGAAHEQRRRLG